jgi:subtilisin family serine protease
MMDRVFIRPPRQQWRVRSLHLVLLVACLLLFIPRTFAASIPNTTVQTVDTNPSALRARLLADMGVPAWYAKGWRGQGVKVAVLDSGFRGYKTHLGEALPERVTVRSFRIDGDLEAKDSQHGILCGEVVHAIAPDAELLFANWETEQPERFLEAVRWARRQGARIVTCSVIMPTWSDGEGGGAVHRALAEALGKGDQPEDALFFASAGNTAQRHWGGSFHDGGDGRHEWAPGRTDNLIRPWEGEKPSVELCWRPGAVYELSVQDLTTEHEAGRCEAKIGASHCCAAVKFDPEAGHTYAARVRLVSGTAGSFHLTVLGGGLEQTTLHGSIPFPADGREVIAVGAEDWQGRRQEYSSCGPSGPSLKPDFAAVVPFPSIWRTRPFSGTSAAAPQAAGLAALLRSAHLDWPAARSRDALLGAAHRSDAANLTGEVGRGDLHLP